MVSSITNTILDGFNITNTIVNVTSITNTILDGFNITNTILNGFKYYKHNSKWLQVLPTQF